MKNAVAFIIFLTCIQPAMLSAHPGKTDRYGGHRCMKGCEEWGLFYREYHLHDKDGRPIRIKGNKQGEESGTQETAEQVSKPAETVPRIDIAKAEVVVTNRFITNIHEENLILSNPFLFILLILLLLLLILRLTRKSKES
jgi:hypothetical protein